MVWNIVSDSSCDLRAASFRSGAVSFETVPLRLQVGEREFRDDDSLSVPELLAAMSAEKTISSSACPAPADFARAFARRTGAVVAMTGAIDVVADADRAYAVRNGCAMMGRITGAGCMLSAMTAAYLAANRETPLEACLAAVCAMGVCGEIARDETLLAQAGNATFRTHLIDAVYNLTPECLKERARYELL